ncbi:hypothetical protein GGS23DRAFT_561240 [Durotheca rogersii]|uniref:uncharacterized protein n=1 Tax=Durotheca rogersii TaxID=419775 RepID=UPI0022209BCE|nr:uncharacterized protein GGS23DRAFT_561240 [Durotheca rogersii]KAI5864656.1 hypothetical protein GGS23DRAFT_561240 [Durotheca rogersii]
MYAVRVGLALLSSAVLHPLALSFSSSVTQRQRGAQNPLPHHLRRHLEKGPESVPGLCVCYGITMRHARQVKPEKRHPPSTHNSEMHSY